MIPYFRLRSNADELAALTEIHRTGAWVVGSALAEVQKELAGLFHHKHVVLTSNGYSALFISIKTMGLQGEKIILPCLSTCFAMSNAIIASGNVPVFSDVNKQDGNCDTSHVRELVHAQKIRYIISPNHAGNLSDINYFKEDLGLTVIEDSCQSFFSSQALDSKADLSVFSFYPTKGVNGIDGGAILTSKASLAEQAQHLVYYNDQEQFADEERFNFRLPNINARLLLANLGPSKKTMNKLNQVRDCYDAVLKNKKGVHRLQNSGTAVAQRYVLCFSDTDLQKRTRLAFEQAEIAMSPFFEWICPPDQSSDFKMAGQMVNSCFCIPYFEDLHEQEIDLIIKTMHDAFS